MSQHFSSSSPASRTHLFGTVNTTTTLDRTAFWNMLSTKEIVGTTLAVVVTICLVAFVGWWVFRCSACVQKQISPAVSNGGGFKMA
jgi:hypothetical protein